MDFKIGEKLIWSVREFDGHSDEECTVTEVHEDYAVARTEYNAKLWIDKDTIKDFRRISK